MRSAFLARRSFRPRESRCTGLSLSPGTRPVLRSRDFTAGCTDYKRMILTISPLPCVSFALDHAPLGNHRETKRRYAARHNRSSTSNNNFTVGNINFDIKPSSTAVPPRRTGSSSGPIARLAATRRPRMVGGKTRTAARTRRAGHLWEQKRGRKQSSLQ